MVDMKYYTCIMHLFKSVDNIKYEENLLVTRESATTEEERRTLGYIIVRADV
jgi:hypothetical protein